MYAIRMLRATHLSVPATPPVAWRGGGAAAAGVLLGLPTQGLASQRMGWFLCSTHDHLNFDDNLVGAPMLAADDSSVTGDPQLHRPCMAKTTALSPLRGALPVATSETWQSRSARSKGADEEVSVTARDAGLAISKCPESVPARALTNIKMIRWDATEA
eukprot:6201558-Pleurochrysis_carterae.AAC.2